MANPDIQLMGATYPAVSGVTLPVAGGGTATFPFVEGSQNITTNNTYDVTNLAQVIVNVAGGGGSGLVYESGTYKPTEDIQRPTISFANSHSTRPFCVLIEDTGGSSIAETNSFLAFALVSWYDFSGTSIYGAETSQYYGRAQYFSKSSSSVSTGGNTISALSGATNGCMPYYLTESGFIPFGASSRLFRSGRTYKWIAVWAPTT